MALLCTGMASNRDSLIWKTVLLTLLKVHLSQADRGCIDDKLHHVAHRGITVTLDRSMVTACSDLFKLTVQHHTTMTKTWTLS